MDRITASLPSALDFIFGDTGKYFWTAALFLGVNSVFNLITTKKFLPWLADEGKKILAYAAFIMIGNRIDDLAVNEMFDWHGSTQLLVCLGLAVKEIKLLIKHIEATGHLAPSILTKRLAQMEGEPTKDPSAVDTKVEQLRKDLDQLMQPQSQETIAEPKSYDNSPI